MLRSRTLRPTTVRPTTLRVVTVAAGILATLLVGCSSGDDDERSSSTSPTPSRCDAARPHGAGTTPGTFTTGGLARSYLLHVPRSYDGRRPVPLVIEGHGYGSNASQQLAYGDLRPLAERDGFVIVLPNGQGRPQHFNLGIVPAPGEADDVEFVEALVDRIADELCIDERRVYATGMSNGALLSLALACRASDRIAAVAPVGAFAWDERCRPTRAVPLLGIVGTADPVVPFEGGRVHCCGGPEIPPVERSATEWASAHGCGNVPVVESRADDVERRTWRDCRDGAEVAIDVVRDGGHTWPGSRLRAGITGRTSDLDGAAEVWGFLRRFTL